jgi:hypothetical protein
VTADLEPLEPHEQILWDAYKEGIKGAIEAADSASDKVLTAAFSIATAYGALVGLVKPSEAASPVAIGAPFFVLGIAAIAAMLALTRTMKPADTSNLETLKGAVTGKLLWKRVWTGIAVAVMAVAIGLAGYVVVDNYAVAESDAEETLHASVQVLAPAGGKDALARACPGVTTGELEGEVHTDTLDQQFIAVDVGAGVCGKAETIRVPSAQVAVIFGSGA